MDSVGSLAPIATSYLASAPERLQALKNTRLGALRGPREFFDWSRVSWPANTGEYMSRVGYNVRYFSANYAIIVGILALWSVITNYKLIIALVILIGGFMAIGRFVPEPVEVAGRTITPQHLYAGVSVIGLILLWISAPFSTVFGILGTAALVVGIHGGLLEPGVEAEYEGVETV